MARNEPQFLEFFLHLTPLRLSLFLLPFYHPYQVDYLIIMEGFGLPMSFGKKSKAAPVNMTAKLEKSKRTEEVRWVYVQS
jgi:hypothetical protein